MIEFQYFDGCPNSDSTLKNLKSLISEGIIEENELTISNIQTIEEAEASNFQGSPTILVDGLDIYTEKTPVGSKFSCRIYIIDDVQTGILTTEYIRDKISKIRNFG